MPSLQFFGFILSECLCLAGGKLVPPTPCPTRFSLCQRSGRTLPFLHHCTITSRTFKAVVVPICDYLQGSSFDVITRAAVSCTRQTPYDGEARSCSGTAHIVVCRSQCRCCRQFSSNSASRALFFGSTRRSYCPTICSSCSDRIFGETQPRCNRNRDGEEGSVRAERQLPPPRALGTRCSGLPICASLRSNRYFNQLTQVCRSALPVAMLSPDAPSCQHLRSTQRLLLHGRAWTRGAQFHSPHITCLRCPQQQRSRHYSAITVAADVPIIPRHHPAGAPPVHARMPCPRNAHASVSAQAG